MRPPTRAKLLFWLILGCLSNYLAEGVSGAGMFPLLHPWWLVVCLPLYGLHTIVLAWVVFRWGRARFSTLLLAGFIFGMYEAYMTKVVWLPPWGPSMLSLGGIAALETAVISFFWHPILAFILPVVIGECILTNSRESWSYLPRFIQRCFRNGTAGLVGLAVLGAACGAFQSFNSPSPLKSVLSGLASFAVIGLLFHAWRRAYGSMEWSFHELLPGKKGLRIMLGILLAMYLALGFGSRREVLPGPGPQAIVWAIYAVLFGLLFLNLRRYSGTKVPRALPPQRFTWKAFLVTAISLTLVSAGLNFVPGNHVWLIWIQYWVFGTVGVVLFLYSAFDTLHPADME